MHIFNIGVTELIIILALALLVVGPEKLPELGQKLGQAVKSLRQKQEALMNQLGPEVQVVKQVVQELRDVTGKATSTQHDALRALQQIAADAGVQIIIVQQQPEKEKKDGAKDAHTNGSS